MRTWIVIKCTQGDKVEFWHVATGAVNKFTAEMEDADWEINTIREYQAWFSEPKSSYYINYKIGNEVLKTLACESELHMYKTLWECSEYGVVDAYGRIYY